ncbi:RIP metalloprotease RseP [Patescibacteria group bacterium]
MFIIGVVLTIALVIIAHEFGHFLFAKLSGVKVEQFALGFGKQKIWSHKKGDTEYSIRPFILGGFVKMLGDSPTSNEEEKKDPRSFLKAKMGRRALIVGAGPFFNFLLAFLIFSFIYFLYGVPVTIEGTTDYVEVASIVEDSPAEGAGIMAGDKIVSVFYGDEYINTNLSDRIQDFALLHSGQEVQVEVERGLEKLTISITPNPLMGIGFGGNTEIVRQPFYKVFWYSARDVVDVSITTVKYFGYIITNAVGGGNLFKEVGGIIRIAELSGDFMTLGIIPWLGFVALISINLAVLNLLPIPILDGGHLLFMAIEKLKGSPVGEKITNFANSIGVVFVVFILLLTLYNDIPRLFTRIFSG